ncbi:MAG: hypothetical protein WDN06_07110 [Asticcacaulis sp.]
MSNSAAIKFAYDHLAHYLHDGDYDPLGMTKFALTKRQPILSKAGDIRLGSMGDGLHMAVITESKTVLKADIKPSRPLPGHIEFKSTNWRSNPAWRADIMVDRRRTLHGHRVRQEHRLCRYPAPVVGRHPVRMRSQAARL